MVETWLRGERELAVPYEGYSPFHERELAVP